MRATGSKLLAQKPQQPRRQETWVAPRLVDRAALPPRDEEAQRERVGVVGMFREVAVELLPGQVQPLYELANPPANDPRHGPVITVTSYAPAERFEMSRDPSGDELKKITAKIAADFTTLVAANRLSLAQ